jgi:membrane protein YdbS with pleckstrin-like domain
MLVVLRPHARRLARPALALLLLAAGLGLAEGFVAARDGGVGIRVALAVLAAAGLLRWVVRPFVVWWHTVYALTSRRIMAYRGVVRRTGHEVPLHGVVDVTVEQKLLERMLRSGTLVVSSAAGVELALRDVPEVVAVHRALQGALEQEDQAGWGGGAGFAADAGDQDGRQDDQDDQDDRDDLDDPRDDRQGDPDGPWDGDPDGAWEGDLGPYGRDPYGGRVRSYADELLDEQARREADFPRPQPPGRRGLFGRRG